MTTLWTHPEYSGGLGRSKYATTGEYSSSASAPISRDVVSMFFRTCIVSMCGFLGALLWFGTPDLGRKSEIARLPQLDFHDASMLRGDQVDSAFLAGDLVDEALQLKSQVRFLASIIKAHLAALPEANQIAYLIVSESMRAKCDPFFVAAVIKSESTFQRTAKSNRGARGLMQLMPDTGEYVSKLQNVAWSGTRTLHDPHLNLRLGIAYLQYLEKKFNGNRERALVAYNWGPGNLEVALRSRSPLPTQPVQYAKKILSTHRSWRKEFTQMAAASGAKRKQEALG